MVASPFNVIAFGFASPWLLWGAGLASIPVIIHLLHKRRFREMDWAAMRFLLEAARKHSRRIRLEQLLLLAVRVLILLLVALALSQPFVESMGAYFQVDAPTHRVIVIDASFSMEHQAAEFSRFDRAKAIAREIIDSARQGDALNLVRIAGSPPAAVVRQPAFQKSQVSDEIDRLEVSHEPGGLSASLQSVLEILKDAPDVRRKEVYFISDFQQTTWRPDSAAERARNRKLLEDVGDKASIMLLDPAQDGLANAAVTSLAANEPLVIAGRPVTLAANVKNFGRSPLSDRRVELFVDGRLAATKQVDLEPGVDAPVDFVVTLESAGEHRLEVQLQDDALELDNHRRLSLPTREELRVLLVNGRPAGRRRETATSYLKTALDPSKEGRGETDFVRPTVVSESELPRVDLSRYDCVFLADVALFDPAEAEMLRAYLESGGGVVFCLGEQVQIEDYNRELYRDGKGILPARLVGRVGGALRPTDVYEFDAGDLSHPIVNPFEGNPNAGLERTFALEYFKVAVAEDAEARVALRFAKTGDPVIVDAPVSRGRVIIVTTSVDNRWGPWPVQGSFVPIIHEIVHHAAAGRWSERQRLVGEPLTRAFPIRAFSASARLTRPDGSEAPLEFQQQGGFATVSADVADRAGFYDMEFGLPLARTETFAVNVDSRESDLARLEKDELTDELLADVDAVYRASWREFQHRTDAESHRRGGLSRTLLATALCLLLIEVVMAWKFAWGMAMLAAAAGVVMVRQTLLFNTAVGVALVVVVAAAVMTAVVLHRRSGATGW